METLGGNEVNPGYRTKKLLLKFPRDNLTDETNKKNLEILYNKENKAFVKKNLLP